MNLAYLFTFFVLVLLVLFALMPFLQHNKSTLEASSADHDEVIELDEEDVPEQVSPGVAPQGTADDYDVEIEVAVARARRLKSTFWECSCGRRMNETDRFCASCGNARQ